MREKLKEINDVRATFTGTFARLGTKSSFGHPKQTVLLTDVKDSAGKIITDHLWLNLTKGFASLNLTPGVTIQFDARVKRYTKGYRGYRDPDSPIETDYKLSHPTNLSVQTKEANAEDQSALF